MFKKLMQSLLALVFVFTVSSPAWADLKQVKMYKEAYPDEKPKCSCCHLDKMPKKDDGKHELNDYGKKVKGLASEPTADTYKSAGKAPEASE